MARPEGWVCLGSICSVVPPPAAPPGANERPTRCEASGNTDGCTDGLSRGDTLDGVIVLADCVRVKLGNGTTKADPREVARPKR